MEHAAYVCAPNENGTSKLFGVQDGASITKPLGARAQKYTFLWLKNINHFKLAIQWLCSYTQLYSLMINWCLLILCLDLKHLLCDSISRNFSLRKMSQRCSTVHFLQ